ncbi:MAG: PAS domain S-box protein [Armatimonadota bacterium]
MNPLITNLQVIGTICYIGALLLALRLVKFPNWRRPAWIMAAGMLLLILLGSSNILQWTGLNTELDRYENYLAVSVPLLWLFLLYTVVYEQIANQLRPYKTVFEAVGSGIAILNPDTSIWLANTRIADMVGLPLEAIVGRRSFLDFVAEPERDSLRSYHRACTQEGSRNLSHEFALVDVNGSSRIVAATISSIPGTGRTVLTVQDITAEKQTEQKADALAGFREAVMETANAWIMIFDTEGRARFWNDAAERISGYSADDMLGRPNIWTELKPICEGQQSFAQVWNNIIENHRPVEDLRTAIETKDGEYRTILWSADIIRSSSGSMLGVVAIGQDVTEQARARQQLQSMAAEQRVLLDNVPVMIFWKDVEGHFIRVNQAFADLYGLEPSDFVGKTVADIEPRHAQKLAEQDAEVVRTGRAKRDLTRVFHGPDGDRWLSTDKVPYYDAQENIAGIIGFTADVTDRQRAYQALVNAQRRSTHLASFREYVMQTANVWVAMFDDEWQLTLWNKEAERISGYCADEVLFSDRAFELLYPDPDYRQQIMNTLKHRMERQSETFQAETRIHCRDGSTRRIDWHVARLDSPDGEFLGMITIGVDVTGARETEERQMMDLRVLRVLNESADSQEMISGILDELSEFTDCETMAIRLSRADDYPYAEHVGLPEKLVTAHSCLCRYDAAGEPARDENGDRILHGLKGCIIDGTIDPKLPFFTDGGSFWTNTFQELMASPHNEDWSFDDTIHAELNHSSVAVIPLRWGGNTVGTLEIGDTEGGLFARSLINYIEDLASSITVAVRRRIAEEALQKERNFSETVVQNAPTLIIGLDQAGRVTLFNALAESLTGYETGEIMNHVFWRHLLPAGEMQEFKQAFSTLRSGEVPPPFDTHIISKNGDQRLINWRATALSDPGGGVWQVIIIGIDVTEHRNLERRIRQSQRMEAIATLAGGIAHDLNNALHSVLSNVELLQLQGEMNEAQRNSIKSIENAVKHASSITQQVTAMAAPADSEKCAIDLNLCINSVMGLLKGVRDRRVALLKNLSEDLPPILADATQIEQVIMNLCVNALHAMPDGGELLVTTDTVVAGEKMVHRNPDLKAGDEFVRIQVTDTGVGMDEDTLTQIFDPFFTTRKDEGGTGLGLAISYSIIQNHNGSIVVDSAPGEGTTFTIYLPYVDEAIVEVSDSDEAVETGSETLLLVEDHDMVRQNLGRLISNLGYTVIEAKTGREALDIYQDRYREIDTVLLDINMPEMNGVETFEKLRAVSPAVTGLFITGFVNGEYVPNGTPEGIMGTLRKPFTISKLSRSLRRLISGSSIN